MRKNYWQELEIYSPNDEFSKIGLNVTEKVLSIPTALHWHEYCEIELILEGKMIHHLNNSSSILEAGNIYLLTPADFHKIEPLEPIRLMNIAFKESLIPTEFLNVFMGKRQAINIQLSQDTFEYLTVITEKLLEEFRRERIHRTCYIKSLLNCLFAEISYAYPVSNEINTDHMSDPIRRALMYIYCNFRDNPSLHNVAEVSGLCDNYFSETFHKATGEKFNRFLNNVKLQYAYDMLINTDNPITEICFSSGFNSMTHFQREFKAKYLFSPFEVRKQKN